MSEKCDFLLQICDTEGKTVFNSSYVITVNPPDTESNFRDFNVDCDLLDNDHLMQPINEADYDSETQVCVDSRSNGPRSFYEHFTVKKKKKLGVKCGAECPVPRKLGVRVSPATAAPNRTITSEPPKSGNFLGAPDQHDVPNGSLQSAKVRRLATGAMPPRATPLHHSSLPQDVSPKKHVDCAETVPLGLPSYADVCRRVAEKKK